MDLRNNHGIYIGLQPQSEGVIGTPFLFEDMVKAHIFLDNGKDHDNVMINFYPEKGEVFVKLSNNHIVSPELKNIQKIVINDSKDIYKPKSIKGRHEIVQILAEDEEEEFVAHKYKKFQKATIGGAYNTTSNLDEYKDVIYYYIIKNGILEEIKQNNSGLKSLAGDNWRTVKSFINENSLDWSKPSDVIQIYSLYRK
ncbi:hypothetical protein EL17_07155 [Anditalea andensis]|uniref:Uncharacterized protein n=2 Tax=Anditalea andensis TaxID=1048983 RepID=A0A074LKY8_9BACT|nr:hypothetical protein EL17_07155 [Anditalea andensis]